MPVGERCSCGLTKEAEPPAGGVGVSAVRRMEGERSSASVDAVKMSDEGVV